MYLFSLCIIGKDWPMLGQLYALLQSKNIYNRAAEIKMRLSTS